LESLTLELPAPHINQHRCENLVVRDGALLNARVLRKRPRWQGLSLVLDGDALGFAPEAKVVL
jgi:hypothetical protein